MEHDTGMEAEGPDLSIDNLAPFGSATSLMSCAPPGWKVLCCQTSISLCSSSLGRKNDRVHCLLGPYWPMLLLTFSIAFFPGYLFCRYFYSSSSTEWSLLVISLWLCTLISLSLTAFRDPGIVRRDASVQQMVEKHHTEHGGSDVPREKDNHYVHVTPVPHSKEDEGIQSTRNSTVLDDIQAEHNRLLGRKHNGGNQRPPMRRFRYCTVCDMEKPPNAEHCETMGRCIYDYDHFCPWVNNAVGRNNSFCFFTFLFSLAALLIVAGTGGVLSLGSSVRKLKRYKVLRGSSGTAG
eukprot:gb/GECG01002702.1/.p1 GENE.gb/GECG01002702.1/~~gb/GECG01002702.1/.p1  ORF type:complete len:293 (+),score=9.82 gb/GECG01002702.1/:1-879(+)